MLNAGVYLDLVKKVVINKSHTSYTQYNSFQAVLGFRDLWIYIMFLQIM